MPHKIKKVLNLLWSLKTFIGAISVGTYIAEHEKIAFWMLVAGAGIDAAIKYFTEAKELEINKPVDDFAD